MPLETAVLVIPPFEVQAFAAPLRQRYMPATWMQVPAHITLLYPYAPAEAIDAATPKLAAAAAGVRPFKLTLDHYGRFPKAVFLEPADPQPLLSLHERLAAIFPDFPVYGGEHGPGLHPHLTLAHSEQEGGLEDILLPTPPSFTFLVDRLHVYLGDPQFAIPFVPRATLWLGGAPA